MENRDAFPIYKAPGIRTGDSWSFYTPEQIHDVDDYADEISQILSLANGRNSLDEILHLLEKSGADVNLTSAIIDDLSALGILSDSREQYLDFHSITGNLPYYARDLTPEELANYTINDTYRPREGTTVRAQRLGSTVIDLGRERQSCRSFSERSLDSDVLMTCLDAAYAADIRPIPSAGGLYPLRLYAIVREDRSDIPAGYYQYDHKDQSLVRFNDEVDTLLLGNVFNDEQIIKNAPVILVVGADLNRQPGKYANRGYRFTLLEAGHAAQNITLAAKELGAGTLEYGGFLDEKLAKELDMPENEVPLITMALGYPGEAKETTADLLNKLEQLVGPDKAIKKISTNFSPEAGKRMYNFQTVAEYEPYGRPGKIDFALGTSPSFELSKLKAIAEAYERYVSGRFRFDVKASTKDFGADWLNPNLVRPYTDEQLQRSDYLERFTEDKELEWIKGHKANGSRVYVPVDLVFYPLDVDRKVFCETDSSGVAAHFDKSEAVKRALLELLERDALMKLWMNKEVPAKIDPDSLPSHFKKRNAYWQSQGRLMEVLDLSHDGVAITLVVSRSADGSHPAVISGAAGSVDSFEAALRKAYQETEGLVIGALESEDEAEELLPEDVRSPRQHGDFYHVPKNAESIAWLWQGEVVDFPEIACDENVVDRYNPIIVELTQDTEPLHVVRVLCPELVPINFGFGNEYHTHPAIDKPDYKPQNPHFFA